MTSLPKHYRFMSMKKLLILLALFLVSCSNNPVETTPPPNNDGWTLLIDRSGTTDSIYGDSGNNVKFFKNSINQNYDSIRVFFEYKGNLSTENGILSLSTYPYGSSQYFFYFQKQPTANYQQIDSSYLSIATYDTVRTVIAYNNPQPSYWFVVKNLKVYGK